jgi:hypothetical protein
LDADDPDDDNDGIADAGAKETISFSDEIHSYTPFIIIVISLEDDDWLGHDEM